MGQGGDFQSAQAHRTGRSELQPGTFRLEAWTPGTARPRRLSATERLEGVSARVGLLRLFASSRHRRTDLTERYPGPSFSTPDGGGISSRPSRSVENGRLAKLRDRVDVGSFVASKASDHVLAHLRN